MTPIVETKGLLRTFTAMLRISEVESGARRAGFTIGGSCAGRD